MHHNWKSKLLYLILLNVCFSLLVSCTKPVDIGIEVIYAIESPIYGWRNDRLLLQVGEEIVALAPDNQKMSLGDTHLVTNHGGIIFCERAGGEMTHFALNGYSTGIWVDDTNTLFYDGYAESGVVGVPSPVSLFPQTPNEDAALSYVPERMGYINNQRIWIIPAKYLHDDYRYEQFRDGIAFPLDWDTGQMLFLLENGKSDVFCAQGALLCSDGFHDGLLRVKREYQVGAKTQILYQFVTKDNRLFRNGRNYDDARDFSEGLAAVKRNGLWGFVDTDGEISIDFQYAVAGDFHDGRAGVSNQYGEFFYIDRAGIPISTPVSGYRFTGEAQGGFFQVALDSGESLLVTENGMVVTEQSADYEWTGNVWRGSSRDREFGAEIIVLPSGVNLYSDSIFRFFGDVCVGRNGNKDVLYSIENGEQLRSADSIGIFCEGLAYCVDGSNRGYIDKSGQWVIVSSKLSLAHTKNMSEGDRQFHRGLACVHYNNVNVMICNPLVYHSGWIENEFDRALSLGLGDETFGDKELTLQELYDLVGDLQGFICSHQEDGVFDNAISFRNPEEYMTKLSGGPITREELATVLCNFAEDIGKPTKCYIGFFTDQETIEYESEVNYISSLGLFDVEDNLFNPKGTVSAKETMILFLRFAEAML